MTLCIPLRGRQRLQQLAVKRPHSFGALHIDDGRLAGHGDRFRRRSDFHLRIHARDEFGRKLDALTLDRMNPFR